MNHYRVDLATKSLSPPCGMNSIRYIGNDYSTAVFVYLCTAVGKNAWDEPDPAYGVMLSIWDSTRRDYVAKFWKGEE